MDSILQVPFALALVLGLIVMLSILLQKWRRFTGKRRRRCIRVVESIALGEKRHLMLVEVSGRRFLLGSTPHHISLLSSSEEGEVEAPNTTSADDPESPARPTFGELLEVAR
ncbi:MAG: flagellar biosynthetic protein FliO [Acidobacteriota bacterium]